MPKRKHDRIRKLMTGAAELSNIAIIGGGASGILAAIAAAENASNTVTIYERGNRIGRKILATGNGRCNMTNINAALENYHGENPEFVNYAIEHFWVSQTLDIFSDMGILYKVEDAGISTGTGTGTGAGTGTGPFGEPSGGKVYPYSDQASSVLDALRRTLDKCGVIVKCGFDVQSIKKNVNKFVISSYKGETARADKVIIASGGKAAPDLGSNGSGYALLKSFGHHITELRPSLVQLKINGDMVKKLKGIKVNANVTLGKFSEYGEVLFTDYGLSGPAVFSLTSRFDAQKTIILDIMPEYSFPEIADILSERRRLLGGIPLEEFFTGMLNKRIGQVILKSVTQSPLSRKAETLTDAEIRKTAAMIKKWEFEISGTMSWNNAQVTKGGARVSEFNPETMESRIVRNLYASGEVLDIDGDCGGYNLQWAWSSGYIAGKNCSEVK